MCPMRLPPSLYAAHWYWKNAIIESLRNYKGLPHRVEWVANIDDIDFYDDSKGTNVGATCAAIAGMTKNDKPQKVVLIAGGMAKDKIFHH